jgi:colicin import membrane protein
MTALALNEGTMGALEQGWGKMVVASILFHVVIFSAVLFVPGSMPTRAVQGVVYEVNLVEMGGDRLPKPGKSAVPPSEKSQEKVSISKKTEPVKRIAPPKQQEKALVIAKKTVEKEEAKKKPEIPPSKRIEEAVSKIQKKVAAEQKDHLQKALSEIEKKVDSENQDRVSEAISRLQGRISAPGREGVGPAGGGVTGKIMEIYILQVTERIRENWSYPATLALEQDKDLEAVFVLRVNNEGKILMSWFDKKSSNGLFDQSVAKAIERSNPLPPFPPSYHRSEEEFEITFNLREMLE